MTKKVIVELVKFESVSITLPEGYSLNIQDWTEEQIEHLAELAHEKIYNTTGVSDWQINEETINKGFIEIVDE